MSRIARKDLNSTFAATERVNGLGERLQALGLTQQQVAAVVTAAPAVFTVSPADVDSRIRFLTGLGWGTQPSAAAVIRRPSLLTHGVGAMQQNLEQLATPMGPGTGGPAGGCRAPFSAHRHAHHAAKAVFLDTVAAAPSAIPERAANLPDVQPAAVGGALFPGAGCPRQTAVSRASIHHGNRRQVRADARREARQVSQMESEWLASPDGQRRGLRPPKVDG